MTHTCAEIETLPAGPETDQTIALLIMGWHRELVQMVPKIQFAGHEPHDRPDMGWTREAWYDRAGKRWTANYVPRYSTDMAAAWTVVETICGPDPLVMGVALQRTLEDGWGAVFRHFPNIHTDTFRSELRLYEGYAETPALAICRAALMWHLLTHLNTKESGT